MDNEPRMPSEPSVPDALETAVGRVRQAMDAELRELSAAMLRAWQEREALASQDRDRAVAEARREAETIADTRIDALRQELEQDLTANRSELQAVREQLHASIPAARVAQLVAAMRRLDDTKSLHTILQGLVEAAAAAAGRASVMILEGGTLRAWAHLGFGADAHPVDVPLAQPSILQTAVLQRTIAPVTATGESAASTPAFMRLAGATTALALPIVVGADVVAVLYADDTGRRSDTQAATWAQELELLVRHASLRLASVTSVRTVELLTSPA
jgi:hypothetical protein